MISDSVNGDTQEASTSQEDDEAEFRILAAHEDYIKRVINNTDKLLAEASSLLEDHEQLLDETEQMQSAATDDSVIFVAEEKAPEKCKRRKRLKVKIQPEEIIDISDSPPESLPPSEANHPTMGDCPICLETLGTQQISATACGHIFCLACIKAAVKKDKKCPNCRKKLNMKQIVPLYL